MEGQSTRSGSLLHICISLATPARKYAILVRLYQPGFSWNYGYCHSAAVEMGRSWKRRNRFGNLGWCNIPCYRNLLPIQSNGYDCSDCRFCYTILSNFHILLCSSFRRRILRFLLLFLSSRSTFRFGNFRFQF